MSSTEIILSELKIIRTELRDLKKHAVKVQWAAQEDVCTIYKVSAKWLQRRRKSGEIPRDRWGCAGDKYRYQVDAIEKLFK